MKLGRIERVALAAAVVAGLSLTPAREAGAQDDDPSAREWNQAGGDAARTGAVGLDPIATAPVEAWRAKLPGPLVAEPVAWGGVVFAATLKGKAPVLLAFSASTGDALGTKPLGGKGPVALAAWQGVAIVAEPGKVRGFSHTGTKFGKGWSFRGNVAGAPCVHRGRVFVGDGAQVHCLDAVTGRKLAKGGSVSALDLGLSEAALKKAVRTGATAARVDEDGKLRVIAIGSNGKKLFMSRIQVGGLDTRKPTFRSPGTKVIGEFAEDPDDLTLWGALPARVNAGDGDEGGAWMAVSQAPFVNNSSGRFVPDGGSGKARGLGMALPPASVNGTIFGFDGGGILKFRTLKASASTDPLIKPADMPKGAQVAPASAAGGVLFFGNWAVDAGKRRILWCRADDRPSTRAVPVASGRLVFGTEDGSLVGLADSSIADASASGGGGGGAMTGPAPDRPKAMDGVLLWDGRQFAGSVEPMDGAKVRVVPEEGDAFEVWETQVVLAEQDGNIDHVGDEYQLKEIWLDAVRGEYHDALETVFAAYLKARAVNECNRVLGKARDTGIPEARANDLLRKLTGKKNQPSKSAVARVKPQEDEADNAYRDGISAAVDYCAEREQLAAAAVLLGELDALTGGKDGSIETRARELIPEGFRWEDDPARGRLWIRWAREILPAGAAFLPPGDSAWMRLTSAPWTGGALGFRTRNLMLFCMDPDPKVLGELLRNGEGSVRANQVLLKGDHVDDVSGDGDRLEVRVHRNREEYLKEETPSGFAMPWSAGYYSPREGISRFYVSRDGKGNLQSERLGEVLAHELTHHYIDQRWVPDSDRGGGPGYWVVEGMATFVEYQAVELGRKGIRFDDPTVANVDTAVEIEKQKKLLPCERLVDMSNHDFHTKLRDDKGGGGVIVKLRSTLTSRVLSERGIFYEQSGALVFFMMNMRGEDGRENMVDYMRDYYMGRSSGSGWLRLGFDSAEELDTEFRKFLSGLRK